MTLFLSVVTSTDELAALQPEWQSFSKDHPEASALHQPAALAIWWKHFGGSPERPLFLLRGLDVAGQMSSVVGMHVLVARAGEELVGALARMWVDVRVQKGDAIRRMLTFLGDPIFAPLPAVLAAPPWKEEVFRLFADHLKGLDWDALGLYPLRRDFTPSFEFASILRAALDASVWEGPLHEVRFARHWDRERVVTQLEHLLRAAQPEVPELAGFIAEVAGLSPGDFAKACAALTERLNALILVCQTLANPESKGPLAHLERLLSLRTPYLYQVLTLPQTITGYHASLSKKRRYQFRVAEEGLKTEGYTVCFVAAVDEDSFRAFVQAHGANHPHSAHLHESTEPYYRELLAWLASQGQIGWTVVDDAGGVPVCWMLLNRFRDTLTYVIGARAVKPAFGLGTYAVHFTIERAIEAGLRSFDFRMGNEPYKSYFHPKAFELCGFIASRHADKSPESYLPRQLSGTSEKVRSA